MLTIICCVAFAIVLKSGHYRSIFDKNAFSAKIQVLISFVFAGYIGVIINRWDRIRNGTLGSIWGALENLNMFAYRILNSSSPNNEVEPLKDCLLRLSRLSFQLTFLACQGDGNLEPLVARGILTEKEKDWLDAVDALGTRPLVVVDWIYSYFDLLKKKDYEISDALEQHIHQEVKSLRGGIGATLGAIGAQLPYAYVHVIYWAIEVLLVALSIEQGVWLATDIFMKSNGEGEWKDPRPGHQWPQDEQVWYANSFLQIVSANILFCLFTEGLLKVCDQLSNPLSKHESSFSEWVYDAFLFNNCKALNCGFVSFTEVLGKDLESLRKK
jgi:hypothetical protein